MMTEPMKYRKKPVVIEAMEWNGNVEAATPIIDWILDNGGTARYHSAEPETKTIKGDVVQEESPAHIAIDTLEGVMRATKDDWIIRGVQGEFYPCKPDIFVATYEGASGTTFPAGPGLGKPNPEGAAWFAQRGLDPEKVMCEGLVVEPFGGKVAGIRWQGYMRVPVEDALALLETFAGNKR